ncbi:MULTISPECIES: zinc ribbon domain-containing protein [Paenibacillus]|uniref:zinc ribbon domain-containing protein n=1 Tax=Paenibacillus TaxID=44249 RepID=UPI002FE3286E
MICPKCQHRQLTEKARYCENCGKPLTRGAAGFAYLQFVTAALRHPVAFARRVNHGQFIAGLITILLFSLLVPLIIYTGFQRLVGFVDNPFVGMVLRPTLAFLIMSLLITAYCYAVVRYGKGPADYREVAARFGVYLVPFTALLLLALLAALLGIHSLQSLLLLIGLLGAWFAVPAFVILTGYSAEGQTPGFPDQLQGTLLVYLAVLLTLALFGKLLFGPLGRLLSDGWSLFL